MVDSLENKNRTDRPIIMVKTSKETLDQFDFANKFFRLSLFSKLIFSGNKKELSHKKIKNDIKK